MHIIRDAIAFIKFIAKLEKEVQAGKRWTEISAADELKKYRRDGTTDITRTFHFGTPTEFQKETYTRVLMGLIDLANVRWPNYLYGRSLDALARRPLWKVGLRYRHGTGHGIGSYLSVHEGPGSISASSSRPIKTDNRLDEGQFFSDGK
ncbi:hypothetical protein KUTeg_007951 [Tegillarca granosa]|uniref:Peptidase M24 domain-containing protein n=1 Tax=Tegillarca granosa TaxID=220873 RepID=A0ABQ9FER7_TEGGR|nr:hypothetical protein KUTeg_007951 [Tegillarca granosa]